MESHRPSQTSAHRHVAPHRAPIDYSKPTLALGVVQITLGVFSVAFGAAAIVTRASYGYVGYGLWSGFVFVLAGGLSTAQGSRPNSEHAAASVGMSVVASLFAIIQLSLAAVSLWSNVTGQYCGYCSSLSGSGAPDYAHCTEWTPDVMCVDEANYVMTLYTAAMLTVAGFIELCIAASVVSIGCGCWDSLCYDDNTVEPVTISVSPASQLHQTYHVPGSQPADESRMPGKSRLVSTTTQTRTASLSVSDKGYHSDGRTARRERHSSAGNHEQSGN